MCEINFFARHCDLSVSAGFETEESRNSYVRLSQSNGHPWCVCSEEEAVSCDCYSSHDTSNR